MQINESAPRVTATIQGVEVVIPAPYNTGHTCTEGEAAALNQLLRENVRNNLAAKVKEKPGDAQALVDQYVVEYEMGVGASRTTDPVEKEAIDIAKEVIRKQHPQVKGAELTKLAQEAVAKFPNIRKAAVKRVKERADLIGSLSVA